MVVEFSRPGGYRNGPKFSRFSHGSIGLPPVIVSRKFPIESRPYRPPTTRSPPPAQPPHSLKKVVKKQPEQQGGGCSWSKQRKGSRHMRERFDPKFLIKGDGVISESGILDSRTTVMIKNIPNKYRSSI